MLIRSSLKFAMIGVLWGVLIFGISCHADKRTLVERIRSAGIDLSKKNEPVELYELNPDETKLLAVSVSEKEFIGLYVQGIDEDLVAGYKLTGVYPAELTNVNAEKEILKTSFSASTKFTPVGKIVKLRLHNNLSNKIFVLIYKTIE